MVFLDRFGCGSNPLFCKQHLKLRGIRVERSRHERSEEIFEFVHRRARSSDQRRMADEVSSVPLSLTTVCGLLRLTIRLVSSRATRAPNSDVSVRAPCIPACSRRPRKAGGCTGRRSGCRRWIRSEAEKGAQRPTRATNAGSEFAAVSIKQASFHRHTCLPKREITWLVRLFVDFDSYELRAA